MEHNHAALLAVYRSTRLASCATVVSGQKLYTMLLGLESTWSVSRIKSIPLVKHKHDRLTTCDKGNLNSLLA